MKLSYRYNKRSVSLRFQMPNITTHKSWNYVTDYNWKRLGKFQSSLSMFYSASPPPPNIDISSTHAMENMYLCNIFPTYHVKLK